MTEISEKHSDSLIQRLKKWEEAGIRLYLDGTPASSESIGQNCVNEDTLYMPDYVTDKEGKIKEIRYDRISLE
ncbi:MAG: hypothetical protein ACI4ED_02245 [Suilimivivens sp.]